MSREVAYLGRWSPRAALKADAQAIAEVYNEGIADKLAMVATKPCTTREMASWFDRSFPFFVCGTGGQNRCLHQPAYDARQHTDRTGFGSLTQDAGAPLTRACIGVTLRR